MSLIPTEYSAQSVMEPLNRFKVWAFRVDARHVDVGDEVWVDHVGNWTFAFPTKRSYITTYKVKSIEWDPEFHVLTFKLKWGTKISAYPDDSIWVACPEDTRGHIVRDDQKFYRRKASANDKLVAKRAKRTKSIR